MLRTDFSKCSLKEIAAAEPLIRDDTQSILIAALACLPANLFGSHIVCCANELFLIAFLLAIVRERSHAKVAQQQMVLLLNQNIPRLDIAMDKLLIVSIL